MLAPIATFHPVLVLTAVGAEPSGLYAAPINTFFLHNRFNSFSRLPLPSVCSLLSAVYHSLAVLQPLQPTHLHQRQSGGV